jgi:hypothetical protein
VGFWREEERRNARGTRGSGDQLTALFFGFCFSVVSWLAVLSSVRFLFPFFQDRIYLNFGEDVVERDK